MVLQVIFKNGETKEYELGDGYELIYVTALGVIKMYAAYDVVKFMIANPHTYNSNMFVRGYNNEIYCIDEAGSSFSNKPVEKYIVNGNELTTHDFSSDEERDEFWRMIYSIPLQ
jgi:hypothetical protein